VMNLEGTLDYLRRCGHFPLEVQVGGYGKRDYPFISRQSRPYERSFSIQGDKVVVMGWPIRGGPFQQPPATPSAWVQEADSIRSPSTSYGTLLKPTVSSMPIIELRPMSITICSFE